MASRSRSSTRIPATWTRGSPTLETRSPGCWLLAADRRRVDDRRVRCIPGSAHVRVRPEGRQERDRRGDQADGDEDGDRDGKRGADALVAGDRGGGGGPHPRRGAGGVGGGGGVVWGELPPPRGGG